MLDLELLHSFSLGAAVVEIIGLRDDAWYECRVRFAGDVLFVSEKGYGCVAAAAAAGFSWLVDNQPVGIENNA